MAGKITSPHGLFPDAIEDEAHGIPPVVILCCCLGVDSIQLMVWLVAGCCQEGLKIPAGMR
jgi:hypothetical protein